jgi:hypothetical protein
MLTERSLFVSYSHSDRDLVVALLKLQPDLWFAAFLDFLHTPRGSHWEKQHQSMIVAADRVLVFWSAHAAKSRHVEEEWKYANNLGKSIIPVLIDRTPLPGGLDALHAVTLGEFRSDCALARHFSKESHLPRKIRHRCGMCGNCRRASSGNGCHRILETDRDPNQHGNGVAHLFAGAWLLRNGVVAAEIWLPLVLIERDNRGRGHSCAKERQGLARNRITNFLPAADGVLWKSSRRQCHR